MPTREDLASQRRRRALRDLDRHEPVDDSEARDRAFIRSFAATHEQPFDRTRLPGHLTASALVASPDLDRVVLLHHRKLDLWLQCGGHAERGDGSPLEAALREAREETGLASVAPHPAHNGLLDVDVHDIPASDGMAAHQHLDLRYLAVADPDQVLHPPAAEVKEVGWFRWDQVEAMELDPGLRRMLEKVRALR